MSRLHKWKKSHKTMTKSQKENCSCDMCKATSLYKRSIKQLTHAKESDQTCTQKQ